MYCMMTSRDVYAQIILHENRNLRFMDQIGHIIKQAEMHNCIHGYIVD